MTDKTLSEKIWGFDYKTLTYKGMTDVTLDIVKVIISLLLIWNYPIAFSSASSSGGVNVSPLMWIGTVLLLALMYYILFPAFSRIFVGGYQHWTNVEEGEQKNVSTSSYKKV